jgi:hypothetical protein
MVEIARRTFTKLAGATAASAAIPAGASALPVEANKIRLNDGSVHPVSPHWYEHNVVKAGVTRENESRRLAILELSDERRHLPQFRTELTALTAFKNVNRAHQHLNGRDYRDIFGAHATVDQVHMNRVTKPCGCVLNFVFDHNQRRAADVAIHPHYPTKVCGTHAHFGNDFKAQFAAVMQS